ncbi:hypothetical protein SO802_028540 [Lithocarpus litseifolius]|uniref:Aminotransferase-like plant mobile domain-containing protein n=1 Tax=Lithocarpus litseifolius TaxID=425828 RepID=A0AAW2BSL2_9ROSI
MTPAKGQGSSHCKAMETFVDNPIAKIVGEDTPLSESEHSKDEERSRNPNSEYAPFIDLWYDAHAHFSVVPGDYLLLPRVACGFPFAAMKRRCPGPLWLLQSQSWYTPRDLFNLRHLVRQWCTATYTFFLSCNEITVTLEDVLNQLLLSILSDVHPCGMELSPEGEVVEAKLKKRMSGNAKLSHWVGAFTKASDAVCRVAFVAFWLCYTCAKFVMGPFTNIVGTITLLTTFDERGIIYLAATNAGWFPYLVDEGIRFVHYSANRVRRKFGLDQDVPDNFSTVPESTISIQPFLRPSAFEFWSRCFTAVSIPGSQRESLYTIAMHRYWQAVITSFEKELLGSHGFSLIPPNGLHAIFFFANPRLLLPTKFVVAYTRKQSLSAIFER